MVRGFSPSFSSGEISPLVHARSDLARYSTGLARLENMIVLPQGGVTRRPGLERIGETIDGEYVRLIPFVYNNTDSAMLELGDNKIRVWTLEGEVVYEGDAPWQRGLLRGLRYAQSGNMMVLTHRLMYPYTITRKSMDNWALNRLSWEGGPWIPGSDFSGDRMITVTWDPDLVHGVNQAKGLYVLTGPPGTFSGMKQYERVQVEYSIPGETVEAVSSPAPTWTTVGPFEVGASINVATFEDWKGHVILERSIDHGKSWTLLKDYERTNVKDQGQIDFSVSESEEDVWFQVRAQHTSGQIKLKVTVEGFIKRVTYLIYESVTGDGSEALAYRYGKYEINGPYGTVDSTSATVIDWRATAWGYLHGYPGAVEWYQDRLVLAGSLTQPQTVWMSRVGDYKDFSTSDPLRDDDAINITLGAKTAGGIHSLVTNGDLLIFTSEGEWKIKGAGDAGAISPSAVVAHQQSSIGSASIQPILTNGRILFVQTHGTKVYSLGYDLNTDGYTGSEVSVLSGHIFEWKRRPDLLPGGRSIKDFCFQPTPDGLFWFALEDGEMATLTFNPEHEVTGWARSSTPGGRVVGLASVPGERQTEVWAIVTRDNKHYIERFARRAAEMRFTDPTADAPSGGMYTSLMQTLRLTWNGQDGDMYSGRKLIARLAVSGLRTEDAWVAPSMYEMEGRNLERKRKISWRHWAEWASDAEVQVDGGFAPDASLVIMKSDDKPMTILAVSPVIGVGA